MRFFIEYRQSDWPEWLVIVKFVVNNKIYSATNILSFITNYGRELIIGVVIRRKEKVKKATKFIERMKKVLEKVEMILRKV